MKNIRYW